MTVHPAPALQLATEMLLRRQEADQLDDEPERQDATRTEIHRLLSDALDNLTPFEVIGGCLFAAELLLRRVEVLGGASPVDEARLLFETFGVA